MELVILTVGGFLWYIAKTLEPKSAQQLYWEKEVEGLKQLEARILDFQEQLEEMCYDPCHICGKVSKFASKCSKSHLEDVKKSKVQKNLEAFKAQENWIWS